MFNAIHFITTNKRFWKHFYLFSRKELLFGKTPTEFWILRTVNVSRSRSFPSRDCLGCERLFQVLLQFSQISVFCLLVSTGLWRDLLVVVKYRWMCVYIPPNQQSCSRANVTLSWLGDTCYGTKLHHLANEQTFHKRRVIHVIVHPLNVQLRGWGQGRQMWSICLSWRFSVIKMPFPGPTENSG